MTVRTKQSSKLDTALQEALGNFHGGRLPEAERLYRRILRDRPSHAEANTGLGHIFRAQGKLHEAEAAYRRVVAVRPNSAEAHYDLGVNFYEQNKLEEAEVTFQRALALSPNMVEVLKLLGFVIAGRGRLADSFPSFRRHAELVYGNPSIAAPGARSIPPLKVQHDKEQHEYLSGSKAVCDGMRVTDRAVRSDSRDDIAAQWQNNSPQYVVIDNFLTDDALERIRRFCWGSAIWQYADTSGYIRALPEHGFVCPLLAQIDEDMRSVYPAILEQHPLRYWWAYKYTSGRRGTGVHADFAAVNINFWITSDEANLDRESGGLIIWDKPAPLEWGFSEYNNMNSQLIRNFLTEAGARAVTIPHRANRAVIFNSNLFHETDNISFKDGYLNRRINITMLYGSRESAAAKN